MIRVAVCDDSPVFLSRTKAMIDCWENKPANIITEMFTDGDSLICAHSEKPFDIILLDIVMPLLNGIEAAREIRERDTKVKIVFLSSSSEFGVASYTVKASNYLLKPLSSDSFYKCLAELVSEIGDASGFITVKGMDATHRLSLADVEYVESQGKHIIFHMAGTKTVESTDALYAYEKTLILDDGFYKCHRSYIVNIHHIDSYSHNEIVMRSGSILPISRSCQKNFESTYFSVVFGRAGDDR